MNREIEFRGYNPKNGKWLYGYYLVNRGKHYIVPDGIQPPSATPEDFEAEPESIGQYTGLQDRNGKKIYEGDIVLQQGYSGVQPMEVRFEQGAFITGYHHGSSTRKTPMLVSRKCMILGNIHDNPELAKTTEQ